MGQRLAVLTIEEFAHRLPPSVIGFTSILALIDVHAVLVYRGSCFGGTTLRAAVGETGFIRLQLELFLADRADFDGKSHPNYDTTLAASKVIRRRTAISRRFTGP
jgi:hypothetical protein